MTDSTSGINHLERLLHVATVIAGRGFAIYQHDYLMLAFGSFRLELGTRHQRWGISWDGKEGFLSVSDPYSPSPGNRAPPVTGKTIRLGFGPDIPYSFIEGYDFGDGSAA